MSKLFFYGTKKAPYNERAIILDVFCATRGYHREGDWVSGLNFSLEQISHPKDKKPIHFEDGLSVKIQPI